MKRRGLSFLNQPGRGAEASIAWDTTGDKDGWGGFIVISDCTRRVSLDLRSDEKKEWDNSVYKLDVLLDQLLLCRKSLRAEGKKRGYIQ